MVIQQSMEVFESTSKLLLGSILAAMGYASLLCWGLLVTFCPVLSVFEFGDIEQGIMATITLSLTCVATYAFASRKATWLLRKSKLVFSSAILLPFVVVVSVALHQVFDFPLMVSVAMWAIAGASYGLTVLGWSTFFCSIPAKYSGVAVASGSMLGTLLFLVIVNIGNTAVALLAIAALIAVDSAIFILLFRGGGGVWHAKGELL